MTKLEVICGPMFAGKTEEFIRRIKRCVIAGLKVQVFKPAMDFRYGQDRVVSHNKTDLEIATGVKPIPLEKNDRPLIHDDTNVVGLDEVQFFDREWIVSFVNGLQRNGIRVVCAGLDQNTFGEPFGPTPDLLALADEVVKLKAICTSCKKDANRTYREQPYSDGKAVEVGGASLYEPRCTDCWNPTKQSEN
jgi:thymidine kinase